MVLAVTISIFIVEKSFKKHVFSPKSGLRDKRTTTETSGADVLSSKKKTQKNFTGLASTLLSPPPFTTSEGYSDPLYNTRGMFLSIMQRHKQIDLYH